MMDRNFAAYVTAALGVAAVALLSAMALPVLGLASSALLFLLPVLFASVRGGIGPGLFAAMAGAAAYNYLLLPPRFTFLIHGPDNVVSVLVLVAVALVTSRLATRLKAREREALGRAGASAQSAGFSALLARDDLGSASARGLAWLEAQYGTARLINGATMPDHDAAFTSLDLSAAAWALHNGDVTGHGSEVMPAADWSFIPLSPRTRENPMLIAVARPDGGATRTIEELTQLQALAQLLGQSCDREALDVERRERERIEQSDRLRRSLLASLAHDFRTPLTVITGRLGELAQGSPEAAEALEQARRLDRRIEDLFGAARLDEGALAPMLEGLDLVDVAGAACEAVALPANITLDRTIPADLPFILGDPVLLHHILINLLDNALRHAASRVLLEARGDGGTVLLTVADDGPGIPEAQRVRIFDRFTRLEGSDRRGGSGLGLSIVKGFAEAMGIAVQVSDGPDGGTRFTLAIPIVEGAAP